ncbi:hypothetical protein AURDEDRAFT_172105 [Auricularia subglabra TFB-10046 SS5]|nr:hypothetical protein AURDEDRAFT_172105 [Auricularia subglabra TFB-10046 SS5]
MSGEYELDARAITTTFVESQEPDPTGEPARKAHKEACEKLRGLRHARMHIEAEFEESEARMPERLVGIEGMAGQVQQLLTDIKKTALEVGYWKDWAGMDEAAA